jgi:hypothetical protein
LASLKWILLDLDQPEVPGSAEQEVQVLDREIERQA